MKRGVWRKTLVKAPQWRKERKKKWSEKLKKHNEESLNLAAGRSKESWWTERPRFLRQEGTAGGKGQFLAEIQLQTARCPLSIGTKNGKNGKTIARLDVSILLNWSLTAPWLNTFSLRFYRGRSMKLLLLLRNDDKGDQSLTFYRNSAKYNVP
jgi:hypothetical protein